MPSKFTAEVVGIQHLGAESRSVTYIAVDEKHDHHCAME